MSTPPMHSIGYIRHLYLYLYRRRLMPLYSRVYQWAEYHSAGVCVHCSVIHTASLMLAGSIFSPSSSLSADWTSSDISLYNVLFQRRLSFLITCSQYFVFRFVYICSLFRSSTQHYTTNSVTHFETVVSLSSVYESRLLCRRCRIIEHV